MASATDTPHAGAAPATTFAALTERASRHAPVALCVLSAGLVALAASRAGGYFPEDYLLIGVIALVGCAVGLGAVGADWRPTPAALVALFSLTGLAAWTGLSAMWSPDPGGATLAMGRTLGYAAAFLLAMVAVGNGRHVKLLLRLLVLVLIGIGILALVGRCRPDLFSSDSAVTTPQEGRLGSVITYANGLGAVVAMGVIGAIGLAGDARESVLVRALATAGGVLATGTMYLTLSRGTGVALAAGLLVVLALSPRRLRLAVATALILGGGLFAILLLRHHPILVDVPATPAARRDEGGPVLLGLLGIAAIAGALQAGLSQLRLTSRRPADELSPPPRTRSLVLAIAPFAVVMLGLIGTYVAVSDRVEGGVNNGTGGLRGFVDRQYVSFMNPVGAPGGSDGRFTSAQSSRSDAYRVALRGLRQHPLAGDGAAGYRVRWFRQRRGPEDIRNAHSLELETVSELGIVGGALLAGFLGSLLFGLRSMVRRRGTITRTQAAGAGGILVVWVVHSALDWDWQLAAVTLPALICGALCLAPDRVPASGSRRRRRRRTAGAH